MDKGIYVGSAWTSRPTLVEPNPGFSSLFSSLLEKVLLVLKHNHQRYQVLFMRDFVIRPVRELVQIGTLV